MTRESFTFAGFKFPRYIVELPKGTPAARLAKIKAGQTRQPTSPYFTAPRPEAAGTGCGGYLGRNEAHMGEGLPGRCWKWADDIIDLRHRGWFCDAFQDQTIRGVVVSLPHGRFFAGWSMGEGMATTIDGDLYDNERDAARDADSMAERAAEDEREYQEQETARIEAEEAAIEAERRQEWAARDVMTEAA